MFCSICGEKQDNLQDVRICRTCGILFCPYCPMSSQSIGHDELTAEPTIQCICGSTSTIPIEHLRRHLVKDFLSIKHNVGTITNIPVEFFQSLMEFREHIVQEGNQFVLLPEDYTFSGEISTIFATAEQFSLEYLQDISTSLRTLYTQLILSQDTLVDPEQLQKIQIQLNILKSKLKTFELGLESYFKPFQNEFAQQRQIFNNYIGYRQELEQKLRPLHQLIQGTDRALYLSPNLSSNLTSIVGRTARILITTKKIIIFKTTKLGLRSKIKILRSIAAASIREIYAQDRKFRSTKLVIVTETEEIEFMGNVETLLPLKNFLRRFTLQKFPASPFDWKNWNITWSAEGYTSLIDRFLQSDLSANNTDFPIFTSGTTNFRQGLRSYKTEKEKNLIEYIEAQLEKNSQRIRICEFIINDLKSRKNTMTVNEYYSLYENFSLKLKDLENDRDTLLGQYKHTIN